jgi:hypothetical protein
LTVKQLQWGRFIGREQVPVDEPYLVIKCGSNSLQLRQFYNKNEIPKVPENNLLLHMKQVTMLLYNGRDAV